MAEIERVIEDLEDMRESFLPKPKFEILEARTTLKRAIQIINELREDCNRYHEWGFHEGYEKAKEQIPKWHLCEECLPTDYTDVLLVVDRYSYVVEDWCRDTVQTYWNGDMKAFDYCKGWQAGHEPKIIAWMELPKFEGVE